MRLESFCFFSLLLMLFWLPIPIASNRIWAWSLFEIWISLQTIILIFYRWNDFPWQKLKSFQWLLLPLVLFQLWGFVQLIPMPHSFISFLSPKAYDVFQSSGFSSVYTLSIDRYATFQSVLKGIAYCLFSINAVLLIDRASRVKMMLYTLVFSGTFQAFYAALMVLLDVKSSWVLGFKELNIATGSFVYKNHLANYLMMTLCMGIGLIISQLHQSPSGSWFVRLKRWGEASLSSKMIVRLCLVIMVIALVMTHSRMGNTAFFLVTVIGGVIGLLFYKNRPRALTVLIISLMVIDTLVVGTVFGVSKVVDRLEATTAQTETRDQVDEWSVNIISDFPLTGTGMGSFYSIFPSYTQYNIGYYDFAHNEYVQFMTEAGVPATIMLGIMVIYAVWLNLQTIRKRHNKVFKGTALGSLMAIVGMLIHISVDFNLQPPANAITFITILILSGCVSSLPSKGLSDNND